MANIKEEIKTVKPKRIYKKFTVSDWFDWLKRNFSLIAVIAIMAHLIQPEFNLVRSLYIMILVEAVALGLSNFATFIFTNYNVANYLLEGDDGEANSVERHAGLGYAGQIFLGVHILCGLTFLFTAIYG